MAAAQAVRRGREVWWGGDGELRATNAKVILYTSPRHENCKPTPNCSPWLRHLILLSFLESVSHDGWLSVHSYSHVQLTFH